LLALLGRFRGRRNGVRTLPALVTTLTAAPSNNLIGTLREETVPRRQKMVDCMIAVDALHFARLEDSAIVIVSDDDDLVPAVIGAAILTEYPVCWVRKRPVGVGLNDALLTSLNVRLGSLPKD
jgi:hypothetical protein